MPQSTTYSREARDLHFNKSLLARLFEDYQKQARMAADLPDFNREFAMQTMNEFGEFENPFVCSLVANYRSRPEIVNYLSAVFYGNPNRLRPVANLPDVISGVMQPPLTLYITNGQEERDEMGLSWWNAAEIDELVARISLVLECWPADEWGPPGPTDICVVSYYSEQIKRIRQRFKMEARANNPQFRNIRVETVMNIQGVLSSFNCNLWTRHLHRLSSILR